MSPRLRIWGACRALAIRSRPLAPRTGPFINSVPRTRWYSDESNNQPPKPIETIENSIKPESTQEAPAQEVPAQEVPTQEVPTQEEPAQQVPSQEVPAQEAPAQEVVEDVEQEAPESIEQGQVEAVNSTEALNDAALEQLFYGGRNTATSQTWGALTPAQEDAFYKGGTILSPDEAKALVLEAEIAEDTELASEFEHDVATEGHKFGLPALGAEGINHKKRYHPVLEQISRLLMRDGKLAAAQRNMAIIMNYLRTAPAPIYSPKFPLIPGAPPAAHLPLNPILYLTIAIDSVAPLLKVKNIAGAGGGGRALELPIPLTLRQRRRTAFMWILEVVNKKPSKGSGRKQFAYRVAEEIVAVVEGRSGVWDKRKTVHKLGTAARANIGSNKLRVKKRM